MAELSVQLLTVPEIAISFAEMGFINTCLKHMKKLFKTLTISPATHGEFIAKGFLHECTHICTDLSFLLNHRQVSKYVIENSQVQVELFEMLLSFNFVNSQTLHLNEHIEIQNTLYPLTFIIEDGIIFALRPLWLNLHRYKTDYSTVDIMNLYNNYLKSVISSINISNTIQNNNSKDVVYLSRTFHIPLLRLLPNVVGYDLIKGIIEDKLLTKIDVELINKSMLHIMDQCIKCQLFYLEIKGGLWVRNGDSMLSQNEKYKTMGFIDRDISSIQMSSLIINMLDKNKKNFLQVLTLNCFPYLDTFDNFINFINNKFDDVLLSFNTAFDNHYYKFIEYSLKCFCIILCRFVSNVAQLISSNWDLNTPFNDNDFVKYFLFKMDVIHYIHFNSTKIADLVRYTERKWPNGNLFKLLEQIGNIKRYGNGEANVLLKSEFIALLDIYWPGDYNIFDENIALNNSNFDTKSQIFPSDYLILHERVINSISQSLLPLIKSIMLNCKFKPIVQMKIIAREMAKFHSIFGNQTEFFTEMCDKKCDSATKTVSSPKRSSQMEALLNLKKKQMNFISSLNGYESSDAEDESNVCCILCHSSGNLNLLCYQMPLSQSCKRPTLDNFYPLYKSIETCGHVTHQRCLETYISNKRYSFKKSFPCPLCKLQVNLTIPYIIELNLDYDSSIIQLNDAFVATFWELLITSSFKKNLLISNHATMLTQLMKHQYIGSIISINYEKYETSDNIYSTNPIADLLKFIFTNKPSRIDILLHLKRLIYIVIIQLLLDVCYNNNIQYNTGFVVYKNDECFRIKCNNKTSLSLNMDLGFKCSKIFIKSIKLYFNKVKICKSPTKIKNKSLDLRLFLKHLHNLRTIIEKNNYNINSIIIDIKSNFGDLIVSKLSDFISLSLWAINCIFPFKPNVLKKFAHEHLINNQLERFNLLWNMIDENSNVSEFITIVDQCINNSSVNNSINNRYKPRFTLKMFKLARNSNTIPKDYMKLLRNTMNIKCIICNDKPLSPVICLFCCKWLCLYCRDGDRHMGSFDHASKCSFGTGCFFLVHQRKVLYICSFTKRYAYVDSIYNGPFGTFRENFTSNSPLELSRSRLITIANDLFFNKRSIKWQQIRLNLLEDEIE